MAKRNGSEIDDPLGISPKKIQVEITSESGEIIQNLSKQPSGIFEINYKLHCKQDLDP